MQPLWATMNLGAMTMKGYSPFPKASILLEPHCGPTKETVVAIMMLYRNIKVKVGPPDGDTDYIDIIAGVLQGDT